MDINQLVFDAAKDSITRFRWFLLTTTLLSSLIVMHLYLEQFGTGKSQLQETIIDDVKLAAKLQKCYPTKSPHASETNNNSKQKGDLKLEPELYPGRFAFLAMEEKSLIERLAQNETCDKAKADTGNIDNELIDFAKTKLKYLRTYNNVKDFKLRGRELPLLNIEIEANDYVPAMAIILSIMIAAAWLSASSLESALRKLTQNIEGRQYIEILKLRLTFLFPGDKGEVKCINNALLYAAMWMPFVVLLWSTSIEIWSAIKDDVGVLPDGNLMLLRWVCLGGCIVWSLIFALVGTMVMGKIKAIAYPAPMPTTNA